MSSTLTITGVLRWDLLGPIYCTAANKLESERTAPFNLTVYCKYRTDTPARSGSDTAQVTRLGHDWVNRTVVVLKLIPEEPPQQNTGQTDGLETVQHHIDKRKLSSQMVIS